eukprot:gene48504-65812_t
MPEHTDALRQIEADDLDLQAEINDTVLVTRVSAFAASMKKRHKGDHDGHHGGAWKIAFADFMTAMMAFFLVMWLVNAANEETKASVASYFNPIKLSDEKPTEKGLKKPVDQAEGEQKKERSQVDEQNDKVGSAAATGEDQTAASGE